MLSNLGIPDFICCCLTSDQKPHSESAVQQIRDSASLTSLSEYEELQRFVSSVSRVCTKIEEVAGQQELHIITFLGNVRDKTWQDIKGVLSTYV